MREVRIDSYFSVPTDLAAEMRSWPEFVGGTGYDVELASGQERVKVELVGATADDCQYVRVCGDSHGRLFVLVLGCVAYALASHSDSVQLMRWE